MVIGIENGNVFKAASALVGDIVEHINGSQLSVWLL
jgi:hypothetical protein